MDEQSVHEYRRSKDIPLVDSAFIAYFLRFAVVVLCLFVCLVGASIAAMRGRLDFLQASFAGVISIQDLTPNVGIFWYIFQEVFDRYRILFILAFHGHLLFYPVPLHFRIGRHQPIGPWVHCGTAIGVISMFKPYPTAIDSCLMLSVLLIQVELIHEGRKHFTFLLTGMLFGLCMFPTMSAVWLSRNAGNANFLYNMTLVINVFGCLLLSDWLRAGIKLRRRQRLHEYCSTIVCGLVEEALKGKEACS